MIADGAAFYECFIFTVVFRDYVSSPLKRRHGLQMYVRRFYAIIIKGKREILTLRIAYTRFYSLVELPSYF